MTRALPLRPEQPPDDAVVVLRAGVMAADGIRRSAERTFDVYAVFGVSVEGVIGRTVLEACRGERVAGYGQIRLSTFGRLRSAGFALLSIREGRRGRVHGDHRWRRAVSAPRFSPDISVTFDHPHFTVVLPDLSELTVARLRGCFDDPIPNPAGPAPG